MTPTQIATAKGCIAQFLTGSSFEDACQSLRPFCYDLQFVTRISDILTVPSEPLTQLEAWSQSEMVKHGKRSTTRSWSVAEDNRLLAGIQKFGSPSGPQWQQIAQFVGNGRTRSQCSQRWTRVLDPRNSQAPWTHEDEQKLIALVKRYGEKAWVKVASEMENRSDVQCRYRYQHLPKSDSTPARAQELPPPQANRLIDPRAPPIYNRVQPPLPVPVTASTPIQPGAAPLPLREINRPLAPRTTVGSLSPASSARKPRTRSWTGASPPGMSKRSSELNRFPFKKTDLWYKQPNDW
jgi:hypothetical protein